MEKDLSYICPQKAEFDLNGIKCTLRPITLEDRSWAEQKFGKKLEEIFAESGFKEMKHFIGK